MQERKPVLLVIDMQLVAFDGKITPPIVGGTELLERVSRLIETARNEKVPIVYLQTCATSGHLYAKDVHGWEIHEMLSPLPNDRVVYKANSNGFEDTNLHDVLSEIGANVVISCGIWSEYCVTATSEGALEQGYTVCVAADGHGTVSETTDAACRVIARQNELLLRKNAMVIGIAEIESKLMGGPNAEWSQTSMA